MSDRNVLLSTPHVPFHRTIPLQMAPPRVPGAIQTPRLVVYLAPERPSRHIGLAQISAPLSSCTRAHQGSCSHKNGCEVGRRRAQQKIEKKARDKQRRGPMLAACGREFCLCSSALGAESVCLSVLVQRTRRVHELRGLRLVDAGPFGRRPAAAGSPCDALHEAEGPVPRTGKATPHRHLYST
ncbi:hypothetical protein C8Q77DRAFT_589177 [Trametes polyzona]|nr:hypothetical protein C8Q77DRAFT_589177 [Trametes polyzona]